MQPPAHKVSLPLLSTDVSCLVRQQQYTDHQANNTQADIVIAKHLVTMSTNKEMPQLNAGLEGYLVREAETTGITMASISSINERGKSSKKQSKLHGAGVMSNG